IEIGGDQSIHAWRSAGEVVPSREVSGRPHLALSRRAPHVARRIECEDIDRAIGIDFCDGRGPKVHWSREINDTSERAGLAVDVDMQHAGYVHEDRIGIGITVEIGPRKSPHAEGRRKRLLSLPRAVAVVAKHHWRALSDADDEIEVAVHLDISGPGPDAIIGWRRPDVGTSAHLREPS